MAATRFSSSRMAVARPRPLSNAAIRVRHANPVAPANCRATTQTAPRDARTHDPDSAPLAATKQSTDAELNKKVVRSVLACAGAALADPLMSLVDTACVGQLGVLPLAALGPNAALFNVVFFVGFSAIGVVATNQICAAHGRGDKAAAGRALTVASVASVIVGTLITAGLLVFPAAALGVFQTNAEMLPYATKYCTIRALGVVAALLMIVFQSAFRALEDMRTPFNVVLIAGAINAVLDPLLSYTFHMGIAGAAWATAFSQIVGALVFVRLIYKRRHEFGIPEAWAAARAAAAANITGVASSVYAYAGATPRHMSALAAAALPSGAGMGGIGLAGVQGGWKTTCASATALWRQLPWTEFLTTTLKLALRCLLILSTWTLSSTAATRMGTYTIAAYQIMQQVLQLQLSVCWAFLAVGQSLVGVAIAKPPAPVEVGKVGKGTSRKALTASQPTQAASSTAAASAPETRQKAAAPVKQRGDVGGSGPEGRRPATPEADGKEWSSAQQQARNVGDRVIYLAVVASAVMALVTWLLRAVIPRIFTANASVLQLVDGSALLMCLMLAISWNNAIEGVLMGARDTKFVIGIYPACVLGFVAALGVATLSGWGLPGIWAALVMYYVGLVALLSARYWMRPCREHI